MHPQLTTYITLISTSGVLNLFLCLYVFLKRHNYTDIAKFFVFYTASITIYCFASAFGLLAENLGQMKFWTIIQYIGMPVSSPLGLLFVLHYLGINVTRKKCLALLAIPVASFIMVATNSFHHLHYRIFEVDPVLGAPYIYQEIGVWYAVHGIFTFGCMFFAFLLMLFQWRETAKAYRPQLIALLFGQFVPITTAFLYLIGATPAGIDPVPMILWLSSLLYLWAISTSRLFTLMPIAKDAIFNSINDGVIVLDESHRLIEFNQASKNNFPKLNKTMFGRNFHEVWIELSGNLFPLKLDAASSQEVKLTASQSEKIYQVRISSLENSKGLLIILTDISEVKRLQLKLEHQAYYDELTQIYNRRAFLRQAEADYGAAKKNTSPFTVLLIDIDHFKRVNDTYGHDVGDQVLVHVAKFFKAQLKEGAVFARYGGEEFVVALDGRTEKEAEELANGLRRDLALHPLVAEEKMISVTLSMGVAETKEEAGETLSQLLNKADKALYAAKQEGRDRVCVYVGSRETVN
ncbi:diguanylate cyclase [Planomicrobium sp. CPCC 101110]|uniref:histidine kinase N-terminal 7TM domain-containing diguanylate cyclase n=1 Tax=Planomicrobium sp. CPCC 101110 TaxID=2599619 RepID=UPI0011B6F542|nr:diguanylate cyclase [Planomicrobium sp. CPCC 101110]TWT27050.1 diguanylate cyclase [Planomicrobium sp. CPCC 101110]